MPVRPLLNEELLISTTLGMDRYYFSFGSDHAFPNGCILIWAETLEAARHKMYNMFGSHWCTSYDQDQWTDYEAKYGKKIVVGEYLTTEDVNHHG